MQRIIFIVVVSLLFQSKAFAEPCRRGANEIEKAEIFKYLSGEFQSTFDRRNFQLGGEGNVKKIFPIDQSCYALAILREHFHRGRESLIKEVSMLEKLKKDGLPVVTVYLGPSLESSVVHFDVGDEAGYFMDWFPNAIQLESKTAQRALTISTLIQVVLGRGKSVKSSEIGRISVIEDARVELEKADFIEKIQWHLVRKLLEGLEVIYEYPNSIIDLQFLILPETGEIKIIDPMDILDPKALLAISNPDLLKYAEETKAWLKSMIQFLGMTLELREYPRALSKYWEKAVDFQLSGLGRPKGDRFKLR